MSRRTIGIDLGTTNSCVATIGNDGLPSIIPNREGETTTPSVVSFGSGGDFAPTVGRAAQRKAVTDPDSTISGVKRLIGRRFDDPRVQRLARSLPYVVTSAPNGDARIHVSGVSLAPQEISALILAELKRVAEEHLGGPIDEAIITVPAHFDNEERQATVDAAEIAGLPVRRLINEPTAAALGYGAHRGEDRRLAVCDLGGGTFDVSIVNVEDGVIEVISTQGDLFLGGEDIDAAMISKLVNEIRGEHSIDLSEDSAALQRLRAAAREAKHVLSSAQSAEIDLPFLAETPAGQRFDLQRTLQREELEAWVAPVLKRLESPCREAMARCGVTPREVDAIVLVGGMTRMPAVQHELASIFGRPPLEVANPDEIVSIGAATQCAILEGLIEGVVLLDVTSRALGLHARGGKYQQVIPRNATIPTREHKIIATTADDQREITFDVYEGEAPNMLDNRHVGRFVCSGLPPAPAGEVMVMVEFTVDVDGILHVAASELGSDERPELRLVATAGLTRAEVRRLSTALAAR